MIFILFNKTIHFFLGLGSKEDGLDGFVRKASTPSCKYHLEIRKLVFSLFLKNIFGLFKHKSLCHQEHDET